MACVSPFLYDIIDPEALNHRAKNNTMIPTEQVNLN